MPNTVKVVEIDHVREKLVELLKDTHVNAAWHHWGYEESADHLIANSVTVQEWISVKDRLPENKSCILMYSVDGGVAEGIYDKDQKRWIQFRWSVLNVPSVTHWMPLPEPPKGE